MRTASSRNSGLNLRYFLAIPCITFRATSYWMVVREQRGGSNTAETAVMCFPRSRGWPCVHSGEQCSYVVLPALAGVALVGLGCLLFWGGAPRARGGGPAF